MVPVVGEINPKITLTSVDFHAPFGPRIVIIWLKLIVNETSYNIFC